jgi:hypothetical protein
LGVLEEERTKQAIDDLIEGFARAEHFGAKSLEDVFVEFDLYRHGGIIERAFSPLFAWI